MATRILLRRDTAAAWGEANPVLGPGEAGYDSTANQMRLGDGATAWLDLPPLTSPGGDGGGGGGIEEAPTDGQQYGRQNGGWTVISSDGGGGPVLPGTIRLLYKGTSYWPSTLAPGEAMAHPDDSTLFLPNVDLDGFELGDFLDEFVKPGTTFLITETADKNRWAHFEATGTPATQTWGRNIPTDRIGGKFAIREGNEVSMVIDLAHAAAVRIGAGTDSMSAVATELSSAVDQLKQQLEHEQEQRKLLEFQLRSVFSVMSKSAQTKLRGVFPENGNEPHQEWDGGDC